MDARAFTGLLPNAYHNAVSWEVLRGHSAFLALPPVDAISLCGKPSYKYIRQEDPLWDALHRGMLTTGRLAGALGFFEASAAKMLKLHKSRASHSELLNAYNHLIQPSLNIHELTDGLENAHITEEGAAQHNLEATLQFNAVSTPEKKYIDAAATATQILPASQSSLEEVRKETGEEIIFSSASRSQSRTRKKKVSSPHLYTDGISEELKLRKARAASSLGLQALRCAWGKTQEPSTLHALTTLFPESIVCEVGLCALDENELPEAWGFSRGSLPPLGASPDCMIRHRKRKDDPSLETAPASLDDTMHSTFDAMRIGTHSSTTSPSTDSSIEEEQDNFWEEVVEVKNTAPFDYPQTNSRGGKRRFVVSDRGPRRHVEPLWVPQVQFHMLCSGTPSALLMSRSATLGARVFRIKRDDRYICLMLSILSVLWQDHVVPKRVPPKDVFERLPQHVELIRRTREIAAAAEVVKEVSAETIKAGHGRDPRFFLD